MSGDRAEDARVPAVMGVGESGVFCAPGWGCGWEVTIHDIGGRRGRDGLRAQLRRRGARRRGLRARHAPRPGSSAPASVGTSAMCICIASVPGMAGADGR